EDGIRDYKVTGVQTCALPISVEEVAPAEFRLVELGREVVVIEEEFLAQQLEESPDQHEQVRRVAGVHDVEAAREEHAPRQDEGRSEERRVGKECGSRRERCKT